jgi:hypothetical protein
MERKVNIIELASELAHMELVDLVGGEDWEYELYEEPNAKVTVYREEWQDRFNQLYDKYFDTIFTLSKDV